MNPTQQPDWPASGNCPSWCSGWFCHRTALGYEHASEPITLILDDERWQVTRHRADEPGPGVTHFSIVVTNAGSYGAGIQHVLTWQHLKALNELFTEQLVTVNDTAELVAAQ